jgi:uncharacterized membrane protein
MDYVVIKWLHILSSTLLFGTGIGSAFYFLCASLRRDPAVVAFVASFVVIADWLFTATTMFVQPATGAYLVHRAGFSWSADWILWSVVLYVLAGLCWLPVVWLQIKMRDLAREAARNGTALSPRFDVLFRWWFALGIPAFCAFVVVFYLMVAKPT